MDVVCCRTPEVLNGPGADSQSEAALMKCGARQKALKRKEKRPVDDQLTEIMGKSEHPKSADCADSIHGKHVEVVFLCERSLHFLSFALGAEQYNNSLNLVGTQHPAKSQ